MLYLDSIKQSPPPPSAPDPPKIQTFQSNSISSEFVPETVTAYEAFQTEDGDNGLDIRPRLLDGNTKVVFRVSYVYEFLCKAKKYLCNHEFNQLSKIVEW